MLINGKPVFQRLVLDQGYYPDGILTAPSDEALLRDIELSLQAGFNGARLHQKVFEERFLYHADRLGYLVWGEFPDWGVGGHGPHSRPPETHRHLHHPVAGSARARLLAPRIVGWCPLNETWQALTRPDHRAGRRHLGDVPGDQGHGQLPARCWTPPATRTACRRRTSTTATTTSSRRRSSPPTTPARGWASPS